MRLYIVCHFISTNIPLAYTFNLSLFLIRMFVY